MATMTGLEIETEVRALLNDAEPAAEEWGDALLVRAINTGEEDIARRHPRTLLAAGGKKLRTFTALTTLANTCNLERVWMLALVYWVMQYCWANESVDRAEQSKRDEYLKLYLAEVS